MVLALLLYCWLGSWGAASDAPSHKFYMTYGRMAVENNQAMYQVKFFTHDLEAALQARFQQPELRLAPTPHIDSLFTTYLNERVTLMLADSTVVPAALASSGEEGDMWWYLVQYEAPSPLEAFTLQNTLLLEVFEEQKNLVKVRHFPSEANRSLYFVAGAERYAISFP